MNPPQTPKPHPHPCPRPTTAPPLPQHPTATERPAPPATPLLPPASPTRRPFGVRAQWWRLSPLRLVPSPPPQIYSKLAGRRPRRSPLADARPGRGVRPSAEKKTLVFFSAFGLPLPCARCAGAVQNFLPASRKFPRFGAPPARAAVRPSLAGEALASECVPFSGRSTSARSLGPPIPGLGTPFNPTGKKISRAGPPDTSGNYARSLGISHTYRH